MSTQDKKPKGPWGQNNTAVDAAAREMAEKKIADATREATSIAEFTESLKKKIRDGDEGAALQAFDEVFFPDTLQRFGSSPTAMSSFLMTVLTETGKKHGWRVIDQLLQDKRIDADTTRKALQRIAIGWQK